METVVVAFVPLTNAAGQVFPLADTVLFLHSRGRALCAAVISRLQSSRPLQLLPPSPILMPLLQATALQKPPKPRQLKCDQSIQINPQIPSKADVQIIIY